MIKQTYCSKDLCLRLEKKGIETSYVMQFEKGGGWYKKYTLDVACKWLREVHLLHIHADLRPFFQERPKKLYHKWEPFIRPLPHSKYHPHHAEYELDYYFDSYDEAVIAAIEYCIDNLI